MAAIVPRTAFAYPSRITSWYAGHMAKSLRETANLLKDIDLVIEARDARLPLTSINGAFDGLLGSSWGAKWVDAPAALAAGGVSGGLPGSGMYGYMSEKGMMREKIVVYTKRDLAEEKYEQPLIKAFGERGQRVMFADTRSDDDVKKILKVAVAAAKANQETSLDTRVLVIGMPNVGKSSLLNALRRVGMRKGKHFKVSAMPGMTKRLTGIVKVNEDPRVYVYDTPGIMVPFLGHGDIGAERGIKYALTAGIKEDVFEPEVVIDYLLWRMNQRLASESSLPSELQSPSYIKALPLPPTMTSPTENLYDLLDPLCLKIGALQKGGVKDYTTAFRFIQKFFREGKLGRWTFDNLEPTGPLGYVPVENAATGEELERVVSGKVGEYLEWMAQQKVDEERGDNLSSTQKKKRETAEKKAQTKEKWKRRMTARGKDPHAMMTGQKSFKWGPKGKRSKESARST